MLRGLEPVADLPHPLIGYCRFEDILPLRECAQKRLLPQGAKTVIAALFPYYVGEYPERNVSRYAMVDDYHNVGSDILAGLITQLGAAFPGEVFAAFIDNSPVREVFAAQRCGLGSIGENGLLTHERYGSRVFIGTIVTTLELKPLSKPAQKNNCMNCGACIKACPTGALTRGAPLNRALCRSSLTQEKREPGEWEKAQIKAGGLVWGCDICGDACPMNQNKPLSPVKAFYKNILPLVTRENLKSAIENKPYNWRGENVILRNLSLVETAKMANLYYLGNMDEE